VSFSKYYHLYLTFFLFCVPVLAILVLSGMVLLPVLLPVAGTDHALEMNSGQNNSANGNFSQIERLALGNVQVRKHLLVSLLP
jgi:calcium permeable stress-gated cation channel